MNLVPTGSRSRVYVRFSLPRLEDRLRILFEVDEEVDLPLAIEELLVRKVLTMCITMYMYIHVGPISNCSLEIMSYF